MNNNENNFYVDEQIVFNVQNLFVLEDISTENLTSKGGTLQLSFYEMLKILNKRKIAPRILILYKPNEGVAGYCMFYLSNDGVHISYICLKRQYQGQNLEQKFISWLKCLKAKTIIGGDICI